MDALHAYGTLLKREGSPGVFTTISKVMDIKGPNLKLDTVDVTSQESTGGWHEKLVTLADAGALTFDLAFIPTDDTQDAAVGLLKDFKDRVKRNFQLVFPDTGATTWAFSAYVAGFVPDSSVKDYLKAAVTLEITGQPTLA